MYKIPNGPVFEYNRCRCRGTGKIRLLKKRVEAACPRCGGIGTIISVLNRRGEWEWFPKWRESDDGRVFVGEWIATGRELDWAALMTARVSEECATLRCDLEPYMHLPFGKTFNPVLEPPERNVIPG